MDGGSCKGQAMEMAVTPSRVRTPSPSTPRLNGMNGVTLGQRQAMIDNLQLEISERAQQLRTQYELHAQGLRSRLEMRINRIPHSLRSVTIQDILDKYSSVATTGKTVSASTVVDQPSKQASASNMTSRATAPSAKNTVTDKSPAQVRQTKRTRKPPTVA